MAAGVCAALPLGLARRRRAAAAATRAVAARGLRGARGASALLALLACGARGRRRVRGCARRSSRRGARGPASSCRDGGAGRALGAERCRPSSKARTWSSPASSPACRSRAPSGLRFRFAIDERGAPAGVPPPARARLVRAASTKTQRSSQPRADAARRPALALHGAPAPAARQPQPARLRLRAVRCSSRACARPATCATRRRRCSTPSAGYPIERMRQRVRDAIYAHVADRRAAGVLAALAVGDQAAIERDDWDLFRNTGVAHLMSISGLHVTMFAWLAGLAVGAAWRRSARAMLRAAGAERGALGRPRRGDRLRALLRLGRAGAAHGLDARDRDAAAGARPALAVAAGPARRRGRRHALDPWALCSRASGCRSWRSAC